MPVYRQQHKTKELLDVLGKIYPQIPEDREPEDLQKLAPDARSVVLRYEEEFNALAKDSETLDGLMQVGREQKEANPPEIDLAEAYMLGKLAIAAERTDDAVYFYRLTMTMLNQPMLNVYRELGEYLIDQKKYGDAADSLPRSRRASGLRTGPLDPAVLHDVPARIRRQDRRCPQGDHRSPRLAARQSAAAFPAGLDLLPRRALGRGRTDPQGDHCRVQRRSGKRRDRPQLAVQPVEPVRAERGRRTRRSRSCRTSLRKLPTIPRPITTSATCGPTRTKTWRKPAGMIEKALKTEPENPAVPRQHGLGAVPARTVRRSPHLPRSGRRSADRHDSTIFDHLGDVLDKLDLKTEAVTAWSKADELERAKPKPDEEVLKRITAKLPAEANVQRRVRGQTLTATVHTINIRRPQNSSQFAVC